MNICYPFIERTERNVDQGPHEVRYNCSVIGYVEQGVLLIRRVDCAITVSRGTVFLLDPGLYCFEEHCAGEQFRLLAFHFTRSDLCRELMPAAPAWLKRFDGELRADGLPLMATYPVWPLLENYLGSVGQYLDAGVSHNKSRFDQLKVCELIHLLYLRPGCPLCLPIYYAMQRAGDSLEDIVRAHCTSKITLQELAGKCRMSVTTFKVRFMEIFDTTPHRWLLNQRLERARLQLVTSTMDISTIADENGFSHPSHFIRLFRSRYEVTPLVYRRQARQQAIA